MKTWKPTAFVVLAMTVSAGCARTTAPASEPAPRGPDAEQLARLSGVLQQMGTADVTRAGIQPPSAAQLQRTLDRMVAQDGPYLQEQLRAMQAAGALARLQRAHAEARPTH